MEEKRRWRPLEKGVPPAKEIDRWRCCPATLLLGRHVQVEFVAMLLPKRMRSSPRA